jgi:hypothetical protein
MGPAAKEKQVVQVIKEMIQMQSTLIAGVVSVGVTGMTISAIIPPKKEFFKPALIGAAMSFLMCWFMVYFVTPFPKDSLANALGNGFSGAMGGFVSAYVTIKGVAKASNVAKKA